MGISEKEHHIKVLENLLKEIKGKIELYSENKNIDLTKEKEIVEALGYAISSLKTDEAYQIMYEGGEILTKDDMVTLLTEIQTEIEELDTYDVERTHGLIENAYISEEVDNIIQQKINELKGGNI